MFVWDSLCPHVALPSQHLLNEVGNVARGSHGFESNEMNALSKIGLTFDEYPSMTEESGSFNLPLTLFGGRFGKDIDTPHNEFLEDDGVSHKVEGGLSLNISYEMTETNQCRLRANIG